MSQPMADRMNRLPKQFFASLSRKVDERIRSGHDVINLGQGNPDLPTPPGIVEALREAALDPSTHRYSAFRGLPELKQAAADFYRREYGVHLDAETEIAILFGGKTGLVEISEIYLNPGDIALVPDPGYPDYFSGVALAGGRMAKMPLLEQNGFLPDFDAVPSDVKKAAKLMFLNYPNNPTGAAADLQFFERAAEFGLRNDVIVVHDFAYAAIGFDGVQPASFLSVPGAKEAGIEIYTLSKTFNMAGWRVAFAAGNREVIAALNLLQDHYYVSLFPAIQKAAAAALTGPRESIEQLVQVYENRRNAFIGELQSHEFICTPPRGSFFAWLPVPAGFTSVQFSDYLLEEADIAVAPGVGFGECGEGFIRIGLLTGQDRLREAAARMAQATAALHR